MKKSKVFALIGLILAILALLMFILFYRISEYHSIQRTYLLIPALIYYIIILFVFFSLLLTGISVYLSLKNGESILLAIITLILFALFLFGLAIMAYSGIEIHAESIMHWS